MKLSFASLSSLSSLRPQIIAAALVASAVTAALVPGQVRAASSGPMKVAVIDMRRAVMETEDGLRAQASLRKYFDRRQGELNARQDELLRKKEDLEKQSKVLSQAALQRALEDWQKQMGDLQSLYADYDREMQRRQGEVTAPIVDRISGLMHKLAVREGYDVVLERQAVPYARIELDVTDQLIVMYNGGEEGLTPSSAAPLPSAAPAGSAPLAGGCPLVEPRALSPASRCLLPCRLRLSLSGSVGALMPARVAWCSRTSSLPGALTTSAACYRCSGERACVGLSRRWASCCCLLRSPSTCPSVVAGCMRRPDGRWPRCYRWLSPRRRLMSERSPSSSPARRCTRAPASAPTALSVEVLPSGSIACWNHTSWSMAAFGSAGMFGWERAPCWAAQALAGSRDRRACGACLSLAALRSKTR